MRDAEGRGGGVAGGGKGKGRGWRKERGGGSDDGEGRELEYSSVGGEERGDEVREGERRRRGEVNCSPGREIH